ncbi:MAG TPA: hypothetical protein PKV33_10585 [Methanothrix sp.]|nr:hypothetical protein [Methanothrix sp.]
MLACGHGGAGHTQVTSRRGRDGGAVGRSPGGGLFARDRPEGLLPVGGKGAGPLQPRNPEGRERIAF